LGLSDQAHKYEEQTLVELVTMAVEVPFYIWVELLTHKRFARNAQSARASSPERLKSMGYYSPDNWFARGKGMQAGSLVEDVVVAALAEQRWKDTVESSLRASQHLYETLGICKEQSNRMMSMVAMRRGILTATLPAWHSMLHLRLHNSADYAMQKFAALCFSALEESIPVESDWHVPYGQSDDLSAESLMLAVANIAAVSYTKDGEKTDPMLADRLLRDGHLSPFEHIAAYSIFPVFSALCSKQDDVDFLNWGWMSVRAWLEGGYMVGTTSVGVPQYVDGMGARQLFQEFYTQNEI
jgi:thymidylate synthase ThyX